jgi:CrcB protein
VYQVLVIAAGGALGALLRYGMSQSVYRCLGRDFPYGTLAVNLLGSFLIGVAVVLIVERMLLPELWRTALIIGFLGAFTTFSTFSFETLALFEDGQMVKALLNIGVSVILCLLATWLGMIATRSLTL